jgi:two-component system, NarL family, nitrate/nitrite response regulator NarL
VVAANPSVRPVILAASHTAKDIVFALASGAFGFLSQNIPSKQLIKSIELVVLGQTVIHPQFHQMAFAQMGVESHSTREFEATSASSGNGGYKAIAEPPRHLEVLSPAALVALPAAETPGTSNGGPAGDVVRNLSRRELIILRTLTEGASNKVIALKLVITESTVKVHMKAILRKLRLQNRTQAAIWARTHLDELASSQAGLTNRESVVRSSHWVLALSVIAARPELPDGTGQPPPTQSTASSATQSAVVAWVMTPVRQIEGRARRAI